MYSSKQTDCNYNENNTGVFTRILHLLRLLHRELSEERKALKHSNVSLLRSSQHRQAHLQMEIEEELQLLQQPDDDDKTAGTDAFNKEKFSVLKSVQRQIDAQIKANLHLTTKKKQQIKDELGRVGRSRQGHRKNFPKFSHLSSPEILDIRR